MISFRDLIIFLAGVEFWHTLTHFFFAIFVPLPLSLKVVTLTPTLNLWGIIINGVITILLLYWVKRLSKKSFMFSKNKNRFY